MTMNHKARMSSNRNMVRIFEYALNQEKTGLSFFQQSVQRMGMGAAVNAFKILIREEEKHILFIRKILEDLKGEQEMNPSGLKELIIEPTDYFDERARSEFFQQCIEGSMVPDVTVFNTAWLIEKDLSEFYERMAQDTKGKAGEAFQMLSGWEKSHERFFRQYRDKLSEVYSKMPWGG